MKDYAAERQLFRDQLNALVKEQLDKVKMHPGDVYIIVREKANELMEEFV